MTPQEEFVGRFLKDSRSEIIRSEIAGWKKKGYISFKKTLGDRLDKLWGPESALTLVLPSHPTLFQQ